MLALFPCIIAYIAAYGITYIAAPQVSLALLNLQSKHRGALNMALDVCKTSVKQHRFAHMDHDTRTTAEEIHKPPQIASTTAWFLTRSAPQAIDPSRAQHRTYTRAHNRQDHVHGAAAKRLGFLVEDTFGITPPISDVQAWPVTCIRSVWLHPPVVDYCEFPVRCFNTLLHTS